MTGEAGATPELDAEALVAASRASPPPRARSADGHQPAQRAPDARDQLQICREARDAARRGIGVVVTHGTDTLEETAMLCDVLHDAEAPIVFTGAIRPASAPGRRRPREPRRRGQRRRQRRPRGMGVLVVLRRRDPPRALRAQDRHDLAGRLLLTADRPARAASPRATRRSGRGSRATRRSTRPTSTAACSSSRPVGRRRHAGPRRADDRARRRRDRHARAPATWRRRCWSCGPRPPSDPGRRLLPPRARRDPERTYGYRGSEHDLRGTRIIPAGFLSPQAARMKLLACLAAGPASTRSAGRFARTTAEPRRPRRNPGGAHTHTAPLCISWMYRSAPIEDGA